MSASAVVAAWAALVLGAGLTFRPRRTLPLPRTSRADGEGARPGISAALAAVGRAARVALARVRSRPLADDPAADRLVGAAVAGIAVLAVASPVLAAVATVAVAAGPHLHRRRRVRAHIEAVEAELPFVVDLLRVAAGAGLTPTAALAPVARSGTGPVSEALGRAAERIDRGEHPATAVHQATESLGPPAHDLTRVLAASVLDGTAAGPALDRLATEVRIRQRRRAEDTARRIPVRMLFPLVLCTLPAFGLLTVVPLLAGSLGALDP